MFEELERFATAHRPCGALSAAVDEPTDRLRFAGRPLVWSLDRWVTAEAAHHG